MSVLSVYVCVCISVCIYVYDQITFIVLMNECDYHTYYTLITQLMYL